MTNFTTIGEASLGVLANLKQGRVSVSVETRNTETGNHGMQMEDSQACSSRTPIRRDNLGNNTVAVEGVSNE